MNAAMLLVVSLTLVQTEPVVVDPVSAEPAAVEPAAGEAVAVEPAPLEVETVAQPPAPELAPVAAEPSRSLSEPWSLLAAGAAVEDSAGEHWRLGAGIGQAWTWSDSPRWAAGLGDPVGHLRLERELHRLFPGLAVNLGLNAWNEGEVKGGARLSLWVMDLALGASLTWPEDGLWRVIFPYVRAAALLSYVQARASNELGADLWAVPGLEGAGGVRLHLGRASVRDWGRLFVFGEASLDLRWPRRVRLEQPENDDDPLLPAVPTRVGRLHLSGWGWQVGAGMVF